MGFHNIEHKSKVGSSWANHMYIILIIILLLAIGGSFAFLTRRALYIRSVTGSEFSAYVIGHQIGHVEEPDDPSGLQSDFCVLQLNHEIPYDKLQSMAMQLAFQYYSLDDGTILSIRYNQGSRSIIEADTVYNPSLKSLRIDLYHDDSDTTMSQTVTWENYGNIT